MESRLLSLEEISRDYPFVILDTSALLYPIGRKRIQTLKDKIHLSRVERDSAVFFKKSLPQLNIYVTDLILKEYFSEKRRPCKGMPYFTTRKKEVMKLRSMRMDAHRKKRKLAEAFGINNRVISESCLSEEERSNYEILLEEHSYFEEKYGLSYPDLDFLVLGSAISQSRESVSLISNDSGIINAWNEMLKKYKSSPERLGFFRREKLNGFRKLRVT